MNNIVDTPLEWLGTVLFLACWLACAAFWVYGLLEYRWLRRSDPRAFRRGPVILRLTDTTLPSHIITLPNAPTATPKGSLVPLGRDCIGFSPQVGSLLHPLAGLRNLLLFKGIISLRSGIAEVEVRAVAGTTWFFFAFIAAWVVFGLFLSPSMECTVNGVAYPPNSAECVSFSFLPPVLLAVVGLGLAWGVRRRARALSAEVLSYLRAPSGAAP